MRGFGFGFRIAQRPSTPIGTLPEPSVTVNFNFSKRKASGYKALGIF